MGIGNYVIILVGLLVGYIIGQDCTIRRVKALFDDVMTGIKRQEQEKEEQRAKGMAALTEIINKAKENQVKKE